MGLPTFPLYKTGWPALNGPHDAVTHRRGFVRSIAGGLFFLRQFRVTLQIPVLSL